MVEIAFCFSQDMWKQAGVSVTSLLRSGGKIHHYRIYLFYYGTVELPKSLFQKILDRYDPLSCFVIQKVENIFCGARITGHVNEGTYLRLLLPELVSAEKIIYCDVDTIFTGDPGWLWEMDLKDKLVYGVPDQINLGSYWSRLKKEQGLRQECTDRREYINAGVLVLNLSALRASEQIRKRWKQMPFENYYYQDQDIINLTCLGRTGLLPLNYNMLGTDYFREKLAPAVWHGLYPFREYRKARKNPVIVHFLGSRKPWNSSQPGNRYFRKWKEYERQYLKLLKDDYSVRK